VVNLDEKCRKQQLGEGWFPTLDDVPKQAISMTVYQIMQCKKIVSCVPYPVKADAIEMTLKTKETTPMVPATKLKEHSDFEKVPFFAEYGEPFGDYKAVLGAYGPDSDGFYISKIKRN
jgi:6-phosphogluconolactonase/glucosamine-6-phosphate isomerase/deaminase